MYIYLYVATVCGAEWTHGGLSVGVATENTLLSPDTVSLSITSCSEGRERHLAVVRTWGAWPRSCDCSSRGQCGCRVSMSTSECDVEKWKW